MSLLAHLDQTEKIGKFNSHALASDGPIYRNVHLANRAGALKLLEVVDNVAVLNVSPQKIEDPRVTNLDTIEDSADVDQAEVQRFLERSNEKLTKLYLKHDPVKPVIVCCTGGCNRSPGVLLYWLTRTMKFRHSMSKQMILENKKRAARVLKMKNRFQRNKDAFSWPTFYGGASRTLLSITQRAYIKD